MLTKQHLAVLRAALQYFDEELGPRGVEALRPYFDESFDGELSADDVARLRELLPTCQLVLNGNQLAALANVLDYCWKDEQADYERLVDEGEDTSFHIFQSLLILHDVLYPKPTTGTGDR